VKMDSVGNAVIVWDDGNGKSFRMQFRDGYWGKTESIGIPCNTVCMIGLEMNPSGDAVMVWAEQSGSSFARYFSIWRNGEWSDPIDLKDAGQNSIVFLNDGHIIFSTIKSAEDIRESYLLSNVFNKGVLSEQKLLFSGISASNLITATNDTDKAMLLWCADGKIMVLEINDADASLKSEIVYENGDSRCDVKSVVLNNDEDAVFAWETTNGVIMKEKRNGAWLEACKVGSSVSSISRNPVLSMDNNGNAVMLWIEYGDNAARLYKMEYR